MASLELSTAGEDGSDFAFDEPLSLSWEIVKGGGTNILAWEESVCEVTVMQLWVFQWFPLHADPQRDGKSGNRTADWTGRAFFWFQQTSPGSFDKRECV
ncbi:hypothetical protein AGIG_G5298 [Arapaima gigas]